jgi:hypothetical protein
MFREQISDRNLKKMLGKPVLIWLSARITVMTKIRKPLLIPGIKAALSSVPFRWTYLGHLGMG